MTKRKHITKRLSVAALLGLALLLLAACTQGEEDFRTSEEVTLQILAVPTDVTKVTLEVDDASYDVPLDTGTVTLKNLELKSTTFTARGLNAKGIVLYKGSKTVNVTKDTDTLTLDLDRLTSNVKVNVAGAVAGETLKATIGGVVQALGDSSTVTGVRTGAGLTLLVEGFDGDTLERQGSTVFDLSETGATVSVTLVALGPDNVKPNAPVLSAPDTVNQNEELTLNVKASDDDGNLASIKVEWGDGSAASSTNVSGGSADEDFTHTYAALGAQIITVTVTDAKGVATQGSTSVTVKEVIQPDEETDVTIDTGKEVRLVTVKATNVPANTSSIQATISSSDSADKTLNLIKEGATWRGSVELLNDTSYSVVLDYDGTKSDAKNFALDDGTDAFTVTVSLGATGGGGSTNRAPVAKNDSLDLLTNDGTVTFNPVKDTLNRPGFNMVDDTDADGDSLNIISFTQPDKGSLSRNGNTFTYNVPTQTGQTSFTYTISDGKGGEATGTVNIIIDLGVGLGG